MNPVGQGHPHHHFDFNSNFPFAHLHLPLAHLHIPLVPLNPINGTEGDDTLLGTDGRDLVLGGGGNDVVNGAGGNDFLGGGEGNDTFAFGPQFGRDVILDFSRGQDHIDLSATGLTFADLTISHHHGDVVVHSSEGTIVLAHLHQLDSSDFVFAV